MFRQTPLIAALLLVLAGCANFPQVDAATPKVIGPRPNYLTPSELAAVNGSASGTDADIAAAESAGDALRKTAGAMRSQ